MVVEGFPGSQRAVCINGSDKAAIGEEVDHDLDALVDVHRTMGVVHGRSDADLAGDSMSFIDILNDPENLERFRQRHLERAKQQGLSLEEAQESWMEWLEEVKDEL